MDIVAANNIIDNSTETNICKMIEQRFQELLQHYRGLILLPMPITVKHKETPLISTIKGVLFFRNTRCNEFL